MCLSLSIPYLSYYENIIVNHPSKFSQPHPSSSNHNFLRQQHEKTQPYPSRPQNSTFPNDLSQRPPPPHQRLQPTPTPGPRNRDITSHHLQGLWIGDPKGIQGGGAFPSPSPAAVFGTLQKRRGNGPQGSYPIYL